MKKKFCLLFLLFIACMTPGVAWGSGDGNFIDMSDPAPGTGDTGWTYKDNVYTIAAGANVTVIGSNQVPDPSQRRIEVAEGAEASITLSGVTITGLDTNQSPLLLKPGATLTLTLVGENTLTAGLNSAGIQAPGKIQGDTVIPGTTLTINGSGSLIATGGDSGAGIGGGYGFVGAGVYVGGGEITISDGKVKATGGTNGAGIGGGYYGDGGTITIEGGDVTAEGIDGGTGIGGGRNGAGGTIKINGGTVTATGSAGIGNGIGNGVPGTFAMNGNGVVYASIVRITTTRYTQGILFTGVSGFPTGTVYGNVTLAEDLEISAGQKLTVPKGASLTVPNGVTLTNDGTITNNGKISSWRGGIAGSGNIIGNPVEYPSDPGGGSGCNTGAGMAGTGALAAVLLLCAAAIRGRKR